MSNQSEIFGLRMFFFHTDSSRNLPTVHFNAWHGITIVSSSEQTLALVVLLNQYVST